MKKTVLLVLTLAFALFVFTACGQTQSASSESERTFDPSQAKIMGDVFPYAGEGETQSAYSETEYVLVFTVDDTYYRAVAKMPEDVSKDVWAIDFEDEEKDQKIQDLISPLEIDSLENLTEQMPKQEELDELIGKTGQELFDDGWTYWSYDLESMEAGLNHGAYAFTVAFEYDGEQMENTDDFDFYEEFKDLKVKSVTLSGLGDAANPEME